jgi:diguanylate cyclase (GGDEF)-like protein
MTSEQVERYVSFVGSCVQFGSALLLCVLFYLLRRHAERRSYFATWARAWLMVILALAVVILYNLPGVLDGPPISGFPRQVGRFSYNFTKILAVSLFVIGTRLYAFGVQSRAAFAWSALVAAAVGFAGVFLLDASYRAVVMQAPVLVAGFAYCSVTLLGLPHSRRSLGSRVTGAVFGVIGAVWVVWLIAFLIEGSGALGELERVLWALARHDGYVDALLQMLLGSGMILLLMEDAKREADDAHAELAVAHDKLRRDALYDSLTGSLNRRAFAEGVGLEMVRATFGAVVVLDMDNLKTVNDTIGHAGGDDLLEHLAHTLRTAIRPSDRLYRWGGDEFLLIFPGARGTDVQQRVEQAIASAESLTIAGVAEPVALVASVGAADYASAEDLSAAIERADGVMYRHKKARRTRDKDHTDTPLPTRTLAAAGD